MDMDQAAVFLAGSVLIMMGFVVIVIGVVAINNVIHRYWKPVRFFTEDSFKLGNGHARFAEPHELEKRDEPNLK
jgi:hypothetical protein